jgi:hypothetical protein
MQSQIFGLKEPLITKEVIMEALNITEGTLNYWGRTFPDFPIVRLPRANRYRKSEVEAWLSSRPPRVGNNKRGLGGRAQKKKEVQSDTI